MNRGLYSETRLESHPLFLTVINAFFRHYDAKIPLFTPKHQTIKGKIVFLHSLKPQTHIYKRQNLPLQGDDVPRLRPRFPSKKIGQTS